MSPNAGHNTRTWRLALGALAFAVSVGAAACSLLLDWNPDGLPCERHTDCFNDGTGPGDDFSCLITKCVKDGSLGFNETCMLNQQCDSEFFCANFACRRPCLHGFQGNNTTCEPGEYCRPILNDRTLECNVGAGCDPGICQQLPDSGGTGPFFCRFYEGACFPGDGCTPGTTDTGCRNVADICVQMDSEPTTVCITPCQINWSNIDYDDNCSPSAQQPTYCQPVGEEGRERLVCLDSMFTAGLRGASCVDFLNDPCRTGHLCLNSRCYLHCDPAVSSAVQVSTFCDAETAGTEPYCCGRNINEPGDDFAVCAASCDDLD